MAEEQLTQRSYPLRANDRAALFEEWCRLNPAPLAEMAETARRMEARRGMFSAKTVVEFQRWFGHERSIAVPFVDQRGNEHRYSINNSDTALLARLLMERYGLHAEIRERRT